MSREKNCEHNDADDDADDIADAGTVATGVGDDGGGGGTVPTTKAVSFSQVFIVS